MENLKNFKNLGLSERTLKAIAARGFETPTPIQEKIIPLILKEKFDVVGQAQTGTGKTLAFGLPVLEAIKEKESGVQVLILVPTRELAIQVCEEIQSLKGEREFKMIPVYGGQSIGQQLGALRKGVSIVVGTPGRILDHIERRSLKLEKITHLILDEADEMLNMGFIEDVEEILKSTSSQKRVMLFSATMSPRILSLAKNYMGEFKIIKVAPEKRAADLIDQSYYKVAPGDKIEALCRIIEKEGEFYGLVFCRTKIEVDVLTRKLGERGQMAAAIHGDISQAQREKILEDFKQQKVPILVATDVAARGIDINNLSHVVNYSVPQNAESYIHRIGRTGRSGKEGRAITFVSPEDHSKFAYIKRISKTEIRNDKLPSVEEIIRLKKKRFRKNLENIIEATKEGDPYLKMAAEVLEGQDPQMVMAALLKLSLKNELETHQYKEIRDSSSDIKGKTRLFVAQGKVDGFTPRKLIDYIKMQVKIPDSKIRDVQIYDKFSFLTVPMQEAQHILMASKKGPKGKRPLIEVAKP